MGKTAIRLIVSALLIAVVLAVALRYTNPGSEGMEASVKESTTTYGFPLEGVPPPTEWNKTYGGTRWDVANSVIETSDGGFLLAGYSEPYNVGVGDFWLTKTNSAGRMLWNRTYGGTGYDEAESVVQTSDGGYAIAGGTLSQITNSMDFWLVKIDSCGNMQWNRTYGGTGYEYAHCLVQTNDYGYVLAGFTDFYGEQGDFWLLKTDSAGNVQWSNNYGGRGRDEAYAVVQTNDGGYAIAGEIAPLGSLIRDFLLVRTESDGTERWRKPYGGSYDDAAYGVVQTDDGGYALVGDTQLIEGGPQDILLVKTDSSGKNPSYHTYGGTDSDIAESVVQITGGGFAIAGGTHSYGAGLYDAWLITTDSTGTINWSQTYGGIGYDYAYSLVKTSDNGYAVAGYTTSYTAGSYDAWLFKTEGSIPWHDVAIIDVTPSKTVVGQGYSLSINVTVENQGNRLEAFNATVYANATIVDTLTNIQTIVPGSTTILAFIWNTSDGEFPRGSYAMRAEIAIVPPPVDADPEDNSLSNGVVSVSYLGDIDANGRVDVFDMFELGKAYASSPSDPRWNANCDIDNSGTVDAIDLSLTSETYGRSDQSTATSEIHHSGLAENLCFLARKRFENLLN